MLSRISVQLMALLSAGAISGATGKTVTTRIGTVSGGKCENYDVNYFLAIPYAQAPVGDLRFAAPKLYDAKYDGGILKATSPAPRCIQFGNIFVETGASSEDCLFIDISVPASADADSKPPVKVWLYGGSNQAGSISNALYNGCPSAQDSVVVSIDYRLGPLGFLTYPDAGLEGNFAIRDQLLGLRWIQEEIASFGGDPDKFLLFRQPAGAMDAFVLAALPHATSLFRVMESGGGRDSPDVDWTKPLYSKYIQSLGCTLDGTAIMGCLRKASLTEMNQTLLALDQAPSNSISASTLISNRGEGNAWMGVVDGNIIPDNPAKMGVRVPAIFGSTSLFVLTRYRYSVETLSKADYDIFLTVSFGPLAPTVQNAYPWTAFEEYSPFQGLAAMTAVYTDVSYKCPAYRGLRTAAAKGIYTWAYNFNHTNSCPWLLGMPSNPDELMVYGPTHTGEIPFIFGQTKNLPEPNGSCNFTEAEDAISNFMISAWTSMAKDGEPANSSVWPTWTQDKSDGITINDVVNPGFLNMTEFEFWDKITDEFANVDANAASAAAHTSKSMGTGSPTTMSPALGSITGLFFTLAMLIV